MKFKVLAFFLFFSSSFSFAALPTQTDPREQERQAKLDALYSACLQQKKRDKLCDSVITARQIGDDAVEFIKEYMDLSPAAYAMLTLANMLATGRFRIRTKSFLNPKANHVYDYQTKDNTMTIIYEQSF